MVFEIIEMGITSPCNSFLYMVSQKPRMVYDLKNIIKDLFKAIYIIIIIYVVYQVLKAITGGTWATENIMIAGIGVILTALFIIFGFLINQGRYIGKLEERTKNIGDSLSNLGKDFKEHLNKK